jgi:hypothetical protein
MRGLVLAMVLSPVMIDESIVSAWTDPDEVRGRLLRRPVLPEIEPIPLWHGPVPWIYIPPVWPPLEAEPARRSASLASTRRSVGIIPVGLELPVADPGGG